MAVGDTWRFILAGTFLDQAHQNVLHYKVTAQPGFDPSPTQFATAWAAANLTEDSAGGPASRPYGRRVAPRLPRRRCA